MKATSRSLTILLAFLSLSPAANAQNELERGIELGKSIFGRITGNAKEETHSKAEASAEINEADSVYTEEVDLQLASQGLNGKTYALHEDFPRSGWHTAKFTAQPDGQITGEIEELSESTFLSLQSCALKSANANIPEAQYRLECRYEAYRARRRASWFDGTAVFYFDDRFVGFYADLSGFTPRSGGVPSLKYGRVALYGSSRETPTWDDIPLVKKLLDDDSGYYEGTVLVESEIARTSARPEMKGVSKDRIVVTFIPPKKRHEVGISFRMGVTRINRYGETITFETYCTPKSDYLLLCHSSSERMKFVIQLRQGGRHIVGRVHDGVCVSKLCMNSWEMISATLKQR